MPLPTYEKKESIPAGFEDIYEEQDGKWVPVDATKSLKSALETERDKREAAEKLALKTKRELDAVNTKHRATASGMTEEELTKLNASIRADVEAEYLPKLADVDKVRSENRALKLDNKVKALFKDHGALQGKVDDFWKLHGDEFDLTSDDKPMVKSEPGKDIVKHVQSILKSRKEWTAGTKATGGGTGGSTTATSSNGSAGGLTFEEVMKNPSMAIAAANEA